MGGYKNGKVEIFYGDNPPSNLNILWQKRIVTGGVESSKLMQYNPNLNVWQSFTDKIDKSFISSVQPKSLEEVFKTCIIKNLEADNTLATEDWVGRVRPIQTQMVLVNSIGSEYIIANMPFVQDLISNPTNWMFWDLTKSPSPDYAKRCIAIEYVGTSGSYSNCYKVTTDGEISINVGSNDSFAMFSFLAYYNRNASVLFPYNRSSSSNFNYTMSSAPGYIWKANDGKYHGTVVGYNKSGYFPDPKRFHNHHVIADDMFGPWVDQNNQIGDDMFAAALPSNRNSFNTVFSGGRVPGADGLHWVISSSYINASTSELCFIVFSEDMTYMRYIPINLDGYTFENQMEVYISACYLEGKYLLSVQDGTYYSGKRVVLQSDSLDGKFTYHSTVFDFSDKETFQPGNMFTGLPTDPDGIPGSIANGFLVVYQKSLYFTSSGQSDYEESGNYKNHEVNLWKFDPINKTWRLVVAPCFIATHSGSEIGADYVWSKDHMGGFVIYPMDNEDGKIWFGISACNGSDSYQGTIGYIDLK